MDRRVVWGWRGGCIRWGGWFWTAAVVGWGTRGRNRSCLRGGGGWEGGHGVGGLQRGRVLYTQPKTIRR